MNDMIFRAKRKDNDEWIYGWLVISKYGCTIITKLGEDFIDSYLVYSESISMYIGLRDEDGKRIFGSIFINGEISKGGDILESAGYIGKVVFGKGCFNYEYIDKDIKEQFNRKYIPTYKGFSNFTKIGNQFDNPKLLEAEND